MAQQKMDGRKVVTFKQLLGMAHAKGLQSIKTEPLTVNETFAFFRCTVTMTGGSEFDGHAEATKANTTPAMHNCLPRLAETRAIVRALKLALSVGDVAAEELPEYDSSIEETQPRTAPRKSALDENAPMTEQQEIAIRKMSEVRGRKVPDMTGWTQRDAGEDLALLSRPVVR